VLEVNGALDSAPETVNADPYGAGWMLKIKVSDPGEAAGLNDATGYSGLIA